MAMRRLTGSAAEAEILRFLNYSRSSIDSVLEPFEPTSTFEAWFSTFRGIEELINLPGELDDDALSDRILQLVLLDSRAVVRDFPAIFAGLKAQLSHSVATRVMHTLRQIQALAVKFALQHNPAAQLMATVGHAIGYLQSRRRHLLAFLHTIPGTCRGSRRLDPSGALIQFMDLIETAGLATTSMHYNLMLVRVYPDFELKVDEVAASQAIASMH